jgi:DNA-directed RNA polymerase subunit L
VNMPEHSPYRMALQQNVHDAFDPHFKRANFTRALFSVLRVLKVVPRRLQSHLQAMRGVSIKDVDAQLTLRYTEYTQSLGTSQSVGSMTRFYFSDVGRHDMGVRPCWYNFTVPHRVALGFLRFRVGCHYLRINTGRWERPSLAREARTCTRCRGILTENQIPPDDEDHCLISCLDPVLVDKRRLLLAQLREQHPYPATNTMAGLFTAVQETDSRQLQRALMHFVAKAYEVARRCHKDLEGWRAGREMRMLQHEAELHREADQWLAGQPADSLNSHSLVTAGSGDWASELVSLSVSGEQPREGVHAEADMEATS